MRAMMEAFGSRLQVELLDWRCWRMGVELANAIFEYPEVFHHRQRRHRSLGMLTPQGFEQASIVA
jgi:putative transposase